MKTNEKQPTFKKWTKDLNRQLIKQDVWMVFCEWAVYAK